MSKIRVLVTGAGGYIGRHVVNALVSSGMQVICCDYLPISDWECDVEYKQIDLFNCDYETIYKCLGSPDACIHMAWRNGFNHNAHTHIGDLSSHYKFLTAMVDGGLKQLAVMGSMHEVGYWEGAINEETPCNPLSMYGIAKDTLRRCMMQYCSLKGCILQWLRCYYILGDDLKNNSIFCKLLQADAEGKREFPFTRGKNKYDFIQIDELATMISAVIEQTSISGIINCCSGEPVSLAEKVERFIVDNGLNIKLKYGAFPDRPYDSPCVYGDATKIRQILSNR